MVDIFKNSYLAILLDLRQVLFDLLFAHIVFPLKAGFSKGLLFRFAPVRVYQQLKKKVKNWNFIKIFEGFEETEQSGESNSHLIPKALIKIDFERKRPNLKGFIDKFERKPGAHFSRKVGAIKWRQNLVKVASKFGQKCGQIC